MKFISEVINSIQHKKESMNQVEITMQSISYGWNTNKDKVCKSDDELVCDRFLCPVQTYIFF